MLRKEQEEEARLAEKLAEQKYQPASQPCAPKLVASSLCC